MQISEQASASLSPSFAECEAGGALAGQQGLPFNACPYTFERLGVDQSTFEAHWRKRLDAWHCGWARTRQPTPNKRPARWPATTAAQPAAHRAEPGKD